MKTKIEPYLFFNGRCEEALKFYESVLGAKIGELMTFDEAPESPPEGMMPPDWDQKIMHASFQIGESLIMASDGCGSDDQGFSGFSLSLAPENEEEAKTIFDALAEEGEVEMPLGKTFWSPCFGAVKDKFGLGWMVCVIE